MWSYTKTKDGFKLKYDFDEQQDNQVSGFDIFIPYKQEGRDYLVYWKEEDIEKMVQGLNDGSITFDPSPLDMGFKIHFPANSNIPQNKIIGGKK